jgi:hypothetical protein
MTKEHSSEQGKDETTMKSFPRAMLEMLHLILFLQPFPLNVWLYALITPKFAYLYFGNASVVARTVRLSCVQLPSNVHSTNLPTLRLCQTYGVGACHLDTSGILDLHEALEFSGRYKHR